MRKLAILLVVALAVVANAKLFKEEEYQSQFGSFIRQYSKKYNHDNFFKRYNIFKDNVDKIALHNSGNSSWSMAVNGFADMTADEFFSTRTGYNYINRDFLRAKNAPVKSNVHIRNPTSVDWRTAGAVTPVKNQGQCGSCWSFSATGSMEGAHAIKTKSLISLSEQQLMDCSRAEGNMGCEGGMMDYAFEYVIKNKGITSEANYPYTARDGTCKHPLPESVTTISSYADVTGNSDAALENAAAIGPVSVAIEADQNAFQFYSGGVFNDPSCGTNLDHGVLVVGYNTAGGVPYWIVKNSWGAEWGMEGYIMMARKSGHGMCGINMEPSYPII